MVVYYINKVSDNLRTYTFPFKEGDICMLHEGDIVKTVYIDSEVENNSIFRDFRYVDTKSLRSYHFPNIDTILCAPYGRSKAKGDKTLVSLLLTDCNGEWLSDFLNDTQAILEGARDYWDLKVLCRLTREENIDIVFETPIEESFANRMPKLVYLPETDNFRIHSEELNLSVGDYCFCHIANGIVLIQIDKESNIINNVSDFKLIESVNEPEIMLPLGTTILYDNTSVREDKFLSRFDSIVKQPVSKSILFCALNDLPLSEDEDVKDYLDGKDESDIFSENKHLSSLFLEIIGISEKKIEQRNYSILQDLVNGVPRNEVAKKNNLTQERIRQLYKKILEEVKFILINEVHENEQLRKDNAQLHAQAQLYIEEIQRLRSVVKDESLRETTNQVVDINSHVAELLNTPVQNLNLSVRAINVLNVLGISTFGEIPKIDAAVTLFNVRNSGRKTVHDIEVFIGKFGLQLGMTYSEIVNTLINVDLSNISHFLK
ncbi:DNA-directed RNA polymerase subunit alpha C-terminal domain-containing protein [Prevotella denticola]|uniref:DNA-directed RNA polymerase subunit alpha C-terminal domain-containing protein n=1 Tax=Prevotella denticola TaxID=28129 RepID=UPI000E586F19|nr:DNA-directed RNA polymerase subunit alpha C-terminal domain-containing protein [Prevotella denticola]AXV48993.1 DNA-directed RNA polymerase subunit alpha [Prevotella denticola]